MNKSDASFVKKTGDTLTGGLTFTDAQSPNAPNGVHVYCKGTKTNKDVMILFERSDTGASIDIGVGAGGTNMGIYDRSGNRWLIHTNASTHKVYITGTEVAGWVASSGSNYIRFTNGTQMCWGSTNVQGLSATAKFAQSFKNTSYSVNITGAYGNVAETYWTTSDHKTNQFDIDASKIAVFERQINWFAIGVWK